ncbi:MAG: metallophosphoesterase [Aciduliprofundum sp.]|nr:MAG: metallophosphoesterase [Aciduliprofundum sp.]
MRIGSELVIISDVHSNIFALEAVLSKIGRDSKIIHAGDVVGYYTFPNEVISTFRKREIISIRGNHDLALISGDYSNFNEYAVRALHWTYRNINRESYIYIASLKETARVNIFGKRIAIYHGSPWDLNYYLMEDEVTPGIIPEGVDILVLGHTHIPYVKKFGNKMVINPGSVGQPRDGDPRASFAVLTSDMDVKIERVEYDISLMENSVREEGLPEFLWKRLYSGI